MTVKAGEKITIHGEIHNFKNVFTKYGKKLQTAIITNSTGQLPVIWFNQTYLSRVMQEGVSVALSGKVDFFSNKLTLISPKFEILKPLTKNLTANGQQLIAIYPETAGLSSKWLRAKIAYCLKNLPEIPDWLLELKNNNQLSIMNNLPKISLTQAIAYLHQPQNQDQIELARHRLAFDELFFLHLESLTRKQQWQQHPVSHPITINTGQLTKFQQALPFKLTNAQQTATQQILNDLTRDKPMNRLLEGDVGSGKTVVAAAAAYAAYCSGYQVAFMAPTEILAQQHYASVSKLLEPLGPTVVLQTSRQKYIRKGQDKPFDIIIGTHALLSDIVNFDRLALAIIDEQHRFGVSQRAKLIQKTNLARTHVPTRHPERSDDEHRESERSEGTPRIQNKTTELSPTHPDTKYQIQNTSPAPHVLSMTATPIPRTIALTLYGDLDLSVLDELPPGRQPIKTWITPNTKRKDAYTWIKNQLQIPPAQPDTRYQIQNTHPQVFIVCPFVEPSETITSVKSATEEFTRLQKIFPEFKLGLLHGQMKGEEKDQILEQFRLGQLDILVTTPVVEVGVDIPNASIMIIEAAERFGLAQLHQLRGRVGRGGQQAYCLLFTSDDSQINKQRLHAMEQYHSGLKLAEIDLQIRGPGQLYGTQQHGFAELKVASYSDTELIAHTRRIAETLFAHISQLPTLENKLKQWTQEHIAPN